MKKIFAPTALAAALAILAGCGVDYSKTMTHKLRGIFGSELDGYTFLSYPTNNYGVGTAYILRTKDAVPNDDNFNCDSGNCLGLEKSGAGTTSETTAIGLDLGGFAAVGHGGPVTFSEKEQADISSKTMLPQIYGLLKLAVQNSYSNGVTTKIQIDRASLRKLRRQPTIDFIGKLPDDNELKKAFKRGDLAMVVADAVVSSMSVSICVDASKNAGLDGALSGNVGKILGDGATLSISIAKSSSGCYSLATTQPVIVALRAVRQPSGGVLAAGDDSWPDWTPVNPKIPAKPRDKKL